MKQSKIHCQVCLPLGYHTTFTDNLEQNPMSGMMKKFHHGKMCRNINMMIIDDHQKQEFNFPITRIKYIFRDHGIKQIDTERVILHLLWSILYLMYTFSNDKFKSFIFPNLLLLEL